MRIECRGIFNRHGRRRRTASFGGSHVVTEWILAAPLIPETSNGRRTFGRRAVFAGPRGTEVATHDVFPRMLTRNASCRFVNIVVVVGVVLRSPDVPAPQNFRTALGCDQRIAFLERIGRFERQIEAVDFERTVFDHRIFGNGITRRTGHFPKHFVGNTVGGECRACDRGIDGGLRADRVDTVALDIDPEFVFAGLVDHVTVRRCVGRQILEIVDGDAQVGHVEILDVRFDRVDLVALDVEVGRGVAARIDTEGHFGVGLAVVGDGTRCDDAHAIFVGNIRAALVFGSCDAAVAAGQVLGNIPDMFRTRNVRSGVLFVNEFRILVVEVFGSGRSGPNTRIACCLRRQRNLIRHVFEAHRGQFQCRRSRRFVDVDRVTDFCHEAFHRHFDSGCTGLDLRFTNHRKFESTVFDRGFRNGGRAELINPCLEIGQGLGRVFLREISVPQVGYDENRRFRVVELCRNGLVAAAGDIRDFTAAVILEVTVE